MYLRRRRRRRMKRGEGDQARCAHGDIPAAPAPQCKASAYRDKPALDVDVRAGRNSEAFRHRPACVWDIFAVAHLLCNNEAGN